jgi:hypothetical protein
MNRVSQDRLAPAVAVEKRERKRAEPFDPELPVFALFIVQKLPFRSQLRIRSYDTKVAEFKRH